MATGLPIDMPSEWQPPRSSLERLRQGTLTSEELIALLRLYRLLPPLQRELLLEDAIAPFSHTTEELEQARQQFTQQHQLASDRDLNIWLAQNHLTLAQLEALLIRNLKIEKFKHTTWAHTLESYFLKRKAQLDRIIYSLIRLRNLSMAQELFFRIQEGEQSFAELAKQHSQGPEAHTGGLIGPVELSTPHPQLVKQLVASQPGQLLPPTVLGEWIVIARLEEFFPAQLDAAMRQRLLNELFERWVQEKLNQNLPESLSAASA